MNRIRTKTLISEIKYFSFQKMPDLKDIASFHTYGKGQIIFYEGHLPYGIFILTTGDVEIKYGNSKIERATSPSFLGYSAFINKTVYSATVRATTYCEAYFLSTSVFQNLKENRHPIWLWINHYKNY